jgi:hypothetical protein
VSARDDLERILAAKKLDPGSGGLLWTEHLWLERNGADVLALINWAAQYASDSDRTRPIAAFISDARPLGAIARRLTT